MWTVNKTAGSWSNPNKECRSPPPCSPTPTPPGISIAIMDHSPASEMTLSCFCSSVEDIVRSTVLLFLCLIFYRSLSYSYRKRDIPMNVLNSLPTFRGGNWRVWISGRPLSRRVFSRKKPCLSKKDNRVQNKLNVKASPYAMSARQ